MTDAEQLAEAVTAAWRGEVAALFATAHTGAVLEGLDAAASRCAGAVWLVTELRDAVLTRLAAKG